MAAIISRTFAPMALAFGLNANLAAAEDCFSYTFSQKVDAIFFWLNEAFGPVVMMVDDVGNGNLAFDAALYDVENNRYGDLCLRGAVTVDDRCQVTVVRIAEESCSE